MPKERVEQWIRERDTWLKEHTEPHDDKTKAEYDRLFPARWEQWLDECHGGCLLARPEMKSIVEEGLRHFDGEKYVLGEFMVMPNHVHVLVTPLGEHQLSEIIQGWKSFTAHAINKAMGRKGEFWQKESFDHIVRGPEQMERIIRYIRENVEAASSPLEMIKTNTRDGDVASTVSRKRLLESPDINLSGDRYRETATVQSKWPMVELREVCDLESGSRQKGGAVDSGVYSIGGEQISEDNTIRFEKMKYITEAHFSEMTKGILSKNDVLMVKDGATTGKMGYWDLDYRAAVNEHVFIFRAKKDSIEPKLLFSLLRSQNFQDSLQPFIKGIIGGISLEIKQLQIPLPPLEIQKQIVAELDGYRKIIEGARQILVSYKSTIRVDPVWPIMPLGDVITLQRGYDLPKTQFVKGEVPVVGSNGIIGYHNVGKENGPGVVTGRSGTIGKVHFIDHEFYWPHNTALFVQDFKGNDAKFIMYLLQSIDLKSLGDNVAAVPSLDRKNAHRIPVSLPPLDVQRRIVAELEAEWKLVEANRELIARMEAKIKAKLADVWGENDDGK